MAGRSTLVRYVYWKRQGGKLTGGYPERGELEPETRGGQHYLSMSQITNVRFSNWQRLIESYSEREELEPETRGGQVYISTLRVLKYRLLQGGSLQMVL